MPFWRRREGPPAETGPEQRIGTRFVMRQKMFAPLRDRFQIDLAGDDKLLAKGNFLYHEYRILRGDWPAAIVSKRWFRFRDTYGVEVGPQEDALLMLAITVCVDMLAHKGR